MVLKVTLLPGPSDAESAAYHARRRDSRPAAEWRRKWGSSDCYDKEGEMAKAMGDGAYMRGGDVTQAIVDRLFSNGADRLVLNSKDGRYLGGWSKDDAASQVEEILEAGDVLGRLFSETGDQSNEGAQADRDATKAYVKRLRCELGGESPSGAWEMAQVALIDRILKWLDKRPTRYNARAGGIQGRATKAKAKGKVRK